MGPNGSDIQNYNNIDGSMISIFRKDKGWSITYLRCIIKMRRPVSARGLGSTKSKQNAWKHQEE